ncbi:GNAT family N-acetyltransferase [Burkholderia singularis]|uniref:GNAT family acetyltransferase YjcF n=1 Tax=Burkholderia singularis TaxID=1503053 RepID=A0A238GYA9_9BURK|nr:GNAT family N-acetyltransferase [Burkholderia singularis]SMF97964.1 GNAT family acetyltransferase YjcF [Burkholderia singularis]
MDSIEVEIGDWARLGSDAARIRDTVFVREQRIPAELNLDDDDPLARHAIAYLVQRRSGARRAVATGRLLSTGAIGRVSVLADARRRGVGTRVLDALLAEARSGGMALVWLYAQQRVAAFYLRLGFRVVGEPFVEAGVAHIEMAREL